MGLLGGTFLLMKRSRSSFPCKCECLGFLDLAGPVGAVRGLAGPFGAALLALKRVLVARLASVLLLPTS